MKQNNDVQIRLSIPVLCGIVAPVWFLVALLMFGALRSDYSHFTKAVSELGALGAPNALLWNILGFGAVGMFVTFFSWGLWRKVGFRVAALLIAISGLGFAAAGLFPADMGDMNANTTRLHILASLASFFAFVAAVPAVSRGFWKRGSRRLAMIVAAFGLAAALSVLLRETGMPSGLAQRINFVAYLLWVALVAVGAWKTSPQNRVNVSTPRN